MPAIVPDVDQFWLLIGPVPTGPFTLAQIRQKFANGEVTAGTKACPIGSTEWSPLHRLLPLAWNTPTTTTPFPKSSSRSLPRPLPIDKNHEQNRRSPAPLADSVKPPDHPIRTGRRRLYVLIGVTVLIVAGIGYVVLRTRLPDTFDGYERGHADTVLRYRDRSYDGAKWTRLQESASLARLVGNEEDSVAELWRVAGWDNDNLWVANRFGCMFQLQGGHWRYAGRPKHTRQPWLRVLDQNAVLIGGGEYLGDRHLYTLSPTGIVDLGDLKFCNNHVHVELFPADCGVVYCLTSEMPHLNAGGVVRVVDGERSELRETRDREAVVYQPDNTPLNDHWVRTLRHTRSHRPGTGYAISPAGSPWHLDWGHTKLVRFENGLWYTVADLTDIREPLDMWLTGSGSDPIAILVGANGWVHVRQAAGGTDRTLAIPTEPTPVTLIKVWGTSPDKFWVMNRDGTVWECAGTASRVVVRGLRRDEVEFRDAWVSPTGVVFAITNKHLYRLD